ncbi:MAG: adenosine deaminase [Proteobacteria bacterium]|nr:adenosine deaminase [Pseudomonadota bacterium]
MLISDDLLLALPKTDLHLHLDGSLRLSTILELAERQGVDLPGSTEKELTERVFKDQYTSLFDYLQGFQYTCAVLQTAQALERASRELAEDCIAEGVCYIEVRFAPMLHMTHLTFDEVLLAVNRGLSQAQKEYNMAVDASGEDKPYFYYGIITCALRMFDDKTVGWYGPYFERFHSTEGREVYAMASLELARQTVRARDLYKIPIVGLDLAGNEQGFPAKHHKAAFQYAHKHFLKKTVHAGEAYGAESIFDALTVLYADRIGHGFYLFSEERCTSKKIANPQEYIQSISNHLADRRITIEVCLSSNIQTIPKLPSISKHPLGKMLEERLSTTICTDNRLISNTSICKELRLAVDNFDINPTQLRHQIIYGFKRSFFFGSYLQKRLYVRQVLDYCVSTMRKHGVFQA